MKKTILILGSNSGLAKETIKLIKKKKLFKIIKIDKKKIFFKQKSSFAKLNKVLTRNNPSYIINFIGIFNKDDYDFDNFFFINTKISWEIINFYRKNSSLSSFVILIGSSAVNKPRGNYILYTASKSALNSIAKSANDYFKKNNLKTKIKIINPGPIRTKMRDKVLKLLKIKRKIANEKKPIFYAKKIISLIKK